MLLVVSLSVFAVLLARLFRAPSGTWRYILAGAMAVLAASQLLPVGHPLRQDIADNAPVLGWVLLAMVPVAAYAFLLRHLRKKTGVGALSDDKIPGAHPSGIVQINADEALSRETRAHLEQETRAVLGKNGGQVSLAWRGESGELLGHLQLNTTGDTTEIVLVHVRETARRQGIATSLLNAAEEMARENGCHRLSAIADSWQIPAFFLRCGFLPVAQRPLTGDHDRTWFEKELS